MKTKHIDLLPLYRKYIADTKSGKRFIRNNKKVSASTIKLQNYIYNHLVNFSVTNKFELKVLPANKLNKKTFETQKNIGKTSSGYFAIIYTMKRNAQTTTWA